MNYPKRSKAAISATALRVQLFAFLISSKFRRIIKSEYETINYEILWENQEAPKSRSNLRRKSRFMSKGTNIEAWRGPGGFRDAFWAILSVWIMVLPLWWVVGASCQPKEASMASTGALRWSTKSHKNLCQHRCKKLMRLGPWPTL